MTEPLGEWKAVALRQILATSTEVTSDVVRDSTPNIPRALLMPYTRMIMPTGLSDEVPRVGASN
jgi:hypothetical protein